MKTVRNNYRVIVYPRSIGDYGSISISSNSFTQEQIDRHNTNTCDEIVQQVKRHVDNVGQVIIEFDEDTFCEYCGTIYDGVNICCDKYHE